MLKRHNCYRVVCGWIFAIAALLMAGGCLSGAEMVITKIGFSDRIRTDRVALSEEQKNRDLKFGTYETASDKLIAEIYPATMEGAPANLPLSDCLWLGHHEDEWEGGDAIQLTWETIFSAMDGDNVALFEGENVFGSCRFDNAKDRQSQEFKDGSPAQPWRIKLSDYDADAFSFKAPEDGFHGPRPPDWPGISRDLIELYYPLLVEYNDNSPNPHGECPQGDGFHFEAEAGVVANNPLRCFNCPDTPTGRVQACGSCRIVPYKDSSYLLTSEKDLTFPRWMKPNIMVVQGERRIVRQMTATAVQNEPDRRIYSWSTPVTWGDGRSRWHENFSSNVIISKVRFFQLTNNGTKIPLSNVKDNELYVHYPTLPDDMFSLRYTCPGQATTNEGMVFDLSKSDACKNKRSGELYNPMLTPTYDTNVLGNERQYEPDSVLKHPLIWKVEFDTVPTNSVYVEFTLNYKNNAVGLKCDKLIVDLGQVQVGKRRQEYARGLITNFGGHPLRIDKISLESYPERVNATLNAPAGTFSYRLPYEPKAIPYPIDIPTSGDKVASSGEKEMRPTVTLGKDARKFKLLEIEKSKDCKGKKITVVKSAMWDKALNGDGTLSASAHSDGKILNLYGEPVKMDGQWGFFQNANANFEKKAKANYAEGCERLIAQTGLNVRIPPFDLLPGESIDVLITARPQKTGLLNADLKVEASSLWDPHLHVRPVRTRLLVKGLQGPDLDFMPSVLNFPRYSGGNEEWDSLVAIQNTGQVDMTRSDFSITGADARRFKVVTAHADTHVLQSGQFEDFRIRYTPRICGDRRDPEPRRRWHEAQLRIITDGGEAIVRLKGDGETCRSRPPLELPPGGYYPPQPKMRTHGR